MPGRVQWARTEAPARSEAPARFTAPALAPTCRWDSAPVLAARGLAYTYGPTPALADASLRLLAGDSVALMGPSGSGKSTLLHCLAGILTPDQGAIDLMGTPFHTLNETERSRLRLTHLGMVFQFGDLVRELTLLENVMLPLRLTGAGRYAAREEALEALAALGIADVATRRAGEVSGGQAQRAAVARALVRRPAVILADEPTGSLDSVNAEQVMDILVTRARAMGSALLVVTHDHRMAAHLDRHVTIRDGVTSAAAADCAGEVAP